MGLSMSRKENTQELLLRCKKGEMSAMGELLQNQRQEAIDFIRSLVDTSMQSELDPEDVWQEAAFRAFRAIGNFHLDDEEDFRRWLWTIARNCVIDRIRARQARKRGGGNTKTETAPSGSTAFLLEELAVYHRTPSQSAVAHELIIAIENALRQIPDRYGEALRLRYLEQLTPAVIAGRLGRTEHAVHILCSRGLNALRAEMRSRTRFA
jgi:RNA polymerase sigma factor (sigma-70 family)